MIHNLVLKAVRSDGLIFHYESDDWRTTSVTGVDAADIEVSKEARGVGDGAIITGRRRLPREITITAQAQNHEARAKAQGFHNNRYRVDLYITYNGVTRIARDCELTGKSIPTKNVYKRPDMTIKFLSPHADLFAVEGEQTSFSKSQPMWAWPHAFRSGAKRNFSREEVATEKVIEYLGSSPAQPIIEIESQGYAKSITVKVNDKVAVLNVELKKGDTITIDTYRSYAVHNNKILALGMGDDPYDFRQFVLDYGDNIVKVDAEAGASALRTSIEYIGRYDGV
ncbi:phage distal tail protein [Mogibacterium diversum]